MTDVSDWQVKLDAAARGCTHFDRIVVVAEVASTQDTARQRDLSRGSVLVAGRQSGGRGRLGRRWADTGGDGIAVTFVLRAGAAERTAMVTAVGAALGVERMPDVPVRIKWPNDLYAHDRKLAGILVEVAGDRAFVGIGVNVNQTWWPDELAARAVSLRQITGQAVERPAVVESLLLGLDRAMGMTDAALADAFASRDALRGRTLRFRTAERGRMVELTGTVQRTDPTRGLLVRTGPAGTMQWLAAATTSIV